MSPMPGKVIKINVKQGSKVKAGDVLIVVEAMKMENNLKASKDAVIESINTKVGEMVEVTKPLIVFVEEEKVKSEE